MAYKWKPSKAQRREFAQKMQNDSEFANAYYERKQQRKEKRQASSNFNYETAGGSYIPTEQQYLFCLQNMYLFQTNKEKDAANNVIYGYGCKEKVHHDNIHIVNEKIRKFHSNN